MPEPNEPVAPPAQNQPDPSPKPESPAQRRINELYGKMKQEQERAQQAELAGEELRSQVAELQETVAALKSHQSAPVSNDDPFAPAPAAPQSSGQDVVKVVRDEIQQLVGPLVQGLQQRDVQARLHSAQQQAFLKAAEEFQDLQDRTSELHKTADQIWRSDKHLQQHPHGPYIAALMARGALEQGPLPAATDAQKVAAAQPTGGPSTGPTGGNAPKLEELEAEADRLRKELQTSPYDSAKLWAAYQSVVKEIEKVSGPKEKAFFPGARAEE
jgi:hypothetical protein